MMVQWAGETSNLNRHYDDHIFGYFYIGYMIEAILPRFKHQDLARTECLRFIDPEFSCIFNQDQVETLAIELSNLLNAGLTIEEQVECKNILDYIDMLPIGNRMFMYLRFCSSEYTDFYVEKEYWHRDQSNMSMMKIRDQIDQTDLRN